MKATQLFCSFLESTNVAKVLALEIVALLYNVPATFCFIECPIMQFPIYVTFAELNATVWGMNLCSLVQQMDGRRRGPLKALSEPVDCCW